MFAGVLIDPAVLVNRSKFKGRWDAISPFRFL